MSDRRSADDGKAKQASIEKMSGKKTRKKVSRADGEVKPRLVDSDDGAVQNATRTVSNVRGPRTVPQRPISSHNNSSPSQDSIKVRPVLKLLNGLLTLLVVIVIGAGALVYYMQAAVDATGPLTEAKLLVIPRNDGTQQIAERLEKEGMVGDKRTFLAGLYTIRGASLMPGGRTINLKAGEYEIKPGASIRTIIDLLSEGRSVLTRVTLCRKD